MPTDDDIRRFVPGAEDGRDLTEDERSAATDKWVSAVIDDQMAEENRRMRAARRAQARLEYEWNHDAALMEDAQRTKAKLQSEALDREIASLRWTRIAGMVGVAGVPLSVAALIISIIK